SRAIVQSRARSTITGVFTILLVFIAAFTNMFACSRVALRDCVAHELNITPEAVGPCQLRVLNISLGTPAGPCHHHGLACDFPEVRARGGAPRGAGSPRVLEWGPQGCWVLARGPCRLSVPKGAGMGFGVLVQVWGLGVSLGSLGSGCGSGVWVHVQGLGVGLGCPGWVQVWGLASGCRFSATGEKEEMEELQAYNRRLLHNILPKDVAAHFLARERRNDELYYQSCECVAVMFASISNFSEFYVELEANNEGVECLRLLNEIIADFDEVPRGGE
ncbi:ADCY6 cyclase, partial [Aegotheles bennettii]|nr:ADCY6 cyclase [Aegotheles bennettii]